MFKNKGMFMKLFASHLIILFVSFIVFAGLFISLIHHEMTNRYVRTFEHQGGRIAEHFEKATEQNWTVEQLETSLEMSMDQENRQFLLFDDEGEAVYRADFLQELGISSEVVDRALDGETVNSRVHSEDAETIYLIAAPLSIPAAESPEHALVMVFHEFDRESRQIVWINWVTALVTVALTAILIFYVSRKITAPLRKMRTSAMHYARGDFTHRIEADSNDEIGQLAKTFNYMAQELGSIDQLRKEFVANVSHDLRSPLTSIRGFIGAMIDGTIPERKQKHYLTIMKNETNRLMKLVDDLLDQASLEAGKWKLEKKEYNLSEQIRTILAKMDPNASEQNIDMSLDAEDDVFICADEDRMAQVWVNLLQNALQNSFTGSLVQLSVEKKDEEVLVAVCDEGRGMSEEELKHIWDRFYKADKARTTKSGTGIGLSIVKQIVELHHGEIDVASKQGEGTVFTVILPEK